MKKPCEIGNNALKAKITPANDDQVSTDIPKKNSAFFSHSKLEYVSEFPYLGAMVTESGGSDLDVDSRIRKATMAYYRLSRIWYSRSL